MRGQLIEAALPFLNIYKHGDDKVQGPSQYKDAVLAVLSI